MIEPMRVWAFWDAPPEYRDLSGHGGDEDWVAHLPKSFYDLHGIPLFVDSASAFGCCDVSQHPQPDGSMVIIGAHA